MLEYFIYLLIYLKKYFFTRGSVGTNLHSKFSDEIFSFNSQYYIS